MVDVVKDKRVFVHLPCHKRLFDDRIIQIRRIHHDIIC